MRTRRLPIFPLSLVLFPGAPQLLHIFEPRYRQLLADCQRDDGRFGISFVPADAAGEAAPTPGAVGCVAAIRAIHPLPDGRSNILTVGEERFVLREYVPCDRLYRVAVIETFRDEASVTADVEELARLVAAGFERFCMALNMLSDMPGGAPELPDDPRALSFHVAAALEIDPPVKQELLELRSPGARLTRLHEILDRLNDEAQRRVDVHVRARRNGKSGRAAVAEDR